MPSSWDDFSINTIPVPDQVRDDGPGIYFNSFNKLQKDNAGAGWAPHELSTGC